MDSCCVCIMPRRSPMSSTDFPRRPQLLTTAISVALTATGMPSNTHSAPVLLVSSAVTRTAA